MHTGVWTKHVLQDDPAGGQAVEVGRPDDRIAGEAERVGAQLVGHQQEDVRAPGRGARRRPLGGRVRVGHERGL